MNEKRWLLFAYVPVFTFVALSLGLSFGGHKGFERLFDIVLTLGLNVCAFVWCKIDSTERKYQMGRLFSYAIVIFGTLALIYYLFRSRGFVDGVTSVGWLVLYIVVMMVTTGILSLALTLLLILIGIVSPNVFD